MVVPGDPFIWSGLSGGDKSLLITLEPHLAHARFLFRLPGRDIEVQTAGGRTQDSVKEVPVTIPVKDQFGASIGLVVALESDKS